MTETISIELTINGRAERVAVEPRHLLSDVLRDEIGLTGTHVGCEHGVCGACTVLFDGEAVRSCLIFAVQADGATVTTVEGLTPPHGLSPVQEAMRDCHALQCGFCTPGIVVSMTAYLARHADPSDDELKEALSGNLCRCTGYQGILAAAHQAAGRMAAN
jgi:carbon-monoxide dehydrogenase small subunit